MTTPTTMNGNSAAAHARGVLRAMALMQHNNRVERMRADSENRFQIVGSRGTGQTPAQADRAALAEG